MYIELLLLYIIFFITGFYNFTFIFLFITLLYKYDNRIFLYIEKIEDKIIYYFKLFILIYIKETILYNINEFIEWIK
jgi:hypothetical protein